jgi:hypothetical protein
MSKAIIQDQSRIDAIKTREDLAVFIEELLQDLQENSDSWENADLSRFLDALAAWTNSMEGFYKNNGRSLPIAPEWKTFAEMLVAAKMYE